MSRLRQYVPSVVVLGITAGAHPFSNVSAAEPVSPNMRERVSRPTNPDLDGTRGRIQFTVAQEGKTSFYRYMDGQPRPNGVPISDLVMQENDIDVWNGRKATEKGSFGIHSTGFVLAQHDAAFPPAPADDDVTEIEQWVRQHALPSACKLVKSTLGEEALAVAIFDFTPRWEVPPKNVPHNFLVRDPVPAAHADFTEKSGPVRMHQVLTNEGGQGIITEVGSITLAEANARKDEFRFVFVNIWQPLRPVYTRPLAVCDARTFDVKDLIERKFIFTKRVGYTFGIPYNPNQKWYYFPNMTPKEALLLKVFDSADPPPEGGPHYTTPHVGMKDLATEGKNFPPRASVEIRAIVVLKKR